ncbi:DNA repair protein RAD5 [Smittium culicis]|uniref:DNA repair protein RAD5 n=1 Tax=Smittium culicis TaxID=133412 RepID=A0A1R1XY58_9FUNG|nr:DNA repair protein RAD5 [Smittium culicis]OMJ19454.1 DNA repair protein RAD5 [Smittium culicis]
MEHVIELSDSSSELDIVDLSIISNEKSQASNAPKVSLNDDLYSDSELITISNDTTPNFQNKNIISLDDSPFVYKDATPIHSNLIHSSIIDLDSYSPSNISSHSSNIDFNLNINNSPSEKLFNFPLNKVKDLFETSYLSKDLILERPTKRTKKKIIAPYNQLEPSKNYSTNPSIVWKYIGGIECKLENFNYTAFDFDSNPFIYYPVHINMQSKSPYLLLAQDHNTLVTYGTLDSIHTNLIAPLLAKSLIKISAAFHCNRNSSTVPILISCYSLTSQLTFIEPILNSIAGFNNNYPALELVKSNANNAATIGSYGKSLKTSIFSNFDSEPNQNDKALYKKMYLEDLLGPLAIQSKQTSESKYSITSESNILAESNLNTDHKLVSVFKDLNYSKNRNINKNKDSETNKPKKKSEYKAVVTRMPDEYIEPEIDRYTFNDSSSVVTSLSDMVYKSKESNLASEASKRNLCKLKENLFTLTNLPEATVDRRIKTKMHRHQKQALHFMLARETVGTDILDSEIPVDGLDVISSIEIPDTGSAYDSIDKTPKYKLSSVWSKIKNSNNSNPSKEDIYLNSITGIKKIGKPDPCLGGIIADDMGLGKTLTVISLILSKSPEFKLGTLAKGKEIFYSSDDNNYKINKKKKSIKRKKTSSIVYSDEDSEEFSDFDASISFGVFITCLAANPYFYFFCIFLESHNPRTSSIPNFGKTKYTLKPNKYKNKLSFKPNSSSSNIASKNAIDERFSTEDQAEKVFSDKYRGVIYAGTLIVCPLSTVYNWEDQIKAHTARGSLSTYIYHGSDRTRSAKFLSSFDVVITTYNIIFNEYAKEVRQLKPQDDTSFSIPDRPYVSPLQHLFWDRVVLDEAHIIKDRKTWQSRASCSLTARSRWCLTGTPIQNRIDDLFSLVKFLHFSPLDLWYTWVKYVGAPFHSNLSENIDELKSDKPNIGAQRAQMIIQTLCLRRMKNQVDPFTGKKYLNLPPITHHSRILKFSTSERKLYESISYKAKKALDEFISRDSVLTSYMSVLSYILRLRQLCVHPSLVDKSFKNFSSDKNNIQKNKCKSCSNIKNYKIDVPVSSNIKKIGLKGIDILDSGDSDQNTNFVKIPSSSINQKNEFVGNPKIPKHVSDLISYSIKNNIDIDCSFCGIQIKSTNPHFEKTSVITNCLHMFCGDCLFEAVSSNSNKLFCPKCSSKLNISTDVYNLNISSTVKQKYKLKKTSIFSIPNSTELPSNSDESDSIGYSKFTKSNEKDSIKKSASSLNCTCESISNDLSVDTYEETGQTTSTKITSLLKDLLEIEKKNFNYSQGEGNGSKSKSSKKDPNIEKSVVFSQWTSVLDIVEKILTSNNISFARLDGTMSRLARQKQQEIFSKENNCTVMLVSLKAGGVGLNLTTANNVFMLDPYWNPAIESQAIDRVYRLGQKKSVSVFRYMISNSIEEKMDILKKRKATIAGVSLMDEDYLKTNLKDGLGAKKTNIESIIDLDDFDDLDQGDLEKYVENKGGYTGNSAGGTTKSANLQDISFMLSIE